MTSQRQNALIISAAMLLQCVTGGASQAISVSGSVVVDGMAGAGSVRVAFQETDFQGLTMSIETAKGALATAETDAPTASPTTAPEDVPIYIPYQKMEGVVDCVNTDTGDDNVVIVAGTIQGTAQEVSTTNNYFQTGDRFLTAMYGNQVGNDSEISKDELGEISNLGPQEVADNSDCLYFKASDFVLRPVASGHITVQK